MTGELVQRQVRGHVRGKRQGELMKPDWQFLMEVAVGQYPAR
jgi:hypothetical protein